MFTTLGIYSQVKKSLTNTLISIVGAKDLTVDLLNVILPVVNTNYHINTHNTIINLWRFMLSHKIDFVEKTFHDRPKMTPEDERNKTLLYQLLVFQNTRSSRTSYTTVSKHVQ